MKKIIVKDKKRVIRADFKPDKKTYIEPVIIGERIIAGEKMYIGNDGKLYRCKLFDAMFKVNKGKVLPLYTKGNNPRKNRI